MCVRIVHFGTLTRDCVFCVQMCLLRQRERERDKEFVMNCYEKGETPIEGTCDDVNAKTFKCDN